MTITQLVYFVAVAEELNITRVAERYSVSQPAVSSAIRDLEKEYHITLFRRNHSELYLTAAGNTIYHQAKSLIGHYDTFCQTLYDGAKIRKTLSLAVAPNISAIHLADMLLYAKKCIPDVDISIQEEFIVNMCHYLKNNIIDAACFACPEERMDKDLHYVLVGRLNLAVCASPLLLDIPKRTVSAKDLEGVPLVFQFKSSLLNEVVQNSFNKANIIPNILFRANQLVTALSFVQKGIAAAFLPPELFADNNEVITYTFENTSGEQDMSSFPIYFVYKNRTDATDMLFRVIRDYFRIRQNL